MMTLRNYVTDVVRCENTFILRNQQMEDDTGINSTVWTLSIDYRDKIVDRWHRPFAII
jgi:hypothetical protein